MTEQKLQYNYSAMMIVVTDKEKPIMINVKIK